MKTNKLIITIILVLVVFLGFRFYYKNLRGAWPLLKQGETVQINQEEFESLTVPEGFSISIFARSIPDARVMKEDSLGNIWVSQDVKGLITKLTISNGTLESQDVLISGLKKPHGLAFDPSDQNTLFIAEETQISKIVVYPEVGVKQKVIDLPKGGRHSTRTINFGSDGRLYVSIGSTCDVCLERDPRYASIYSLNKDGTDFKQLAKGLRNSVFFVFQNDKIWATDMGRDLLGDNIPPDEINVIDTKSNLVLNYGWPICYGKNIHDDKFDKNKYIRNPCMTPTEIGSHYDLQAHSAPLGLSFVPKDINWPNEYKNNLIVAYHGSWNRSVPTGYKLVRLMVDENGNIRGEKDFITGWLTKSGAIGRPVDVIFSGQSMYISDDDSGVIYRLIYKGIN